MRNLDGRAILTSLGLPALYWGVVVIGVTVLGQPGVICVTPMAWLLALTVGRDCVRRSRSRGRGTRLIEAGLAGTVIGLVEGVLLPMVVVLIALPEEAVAMVVFSLVMGVMSVLACAIIAVSFGAYCERRRA
jgi:hypothetical protein